MAAGSHTIPLPDQQHIEELLRRQNAIATQRLQRIRSYLTREQSNFITLLPLLLHSNHPQLPGYHNDDTPAGIADYVPDRNTLLIARGHVRGFKDARRPQRIIPLTGLYLIGSTGSLGQDRHSDFDIWLCCHDTLKPKQLQALQEKANKLEKHAATLGIELHFYLMNAQRFRQGQHVELSNESSGSTQHHLLLEEFYRSALRLAGRPLLWWLVPPGHEAEYDQVKATLIEQELISAENWLDFGGLADLSVSEFFSAAHWQLFKSVHSPYKSLLKLMLYESYAEDYPAVRWLSHEVKQRVADNANVSVEDVDPYLMVVQRIEKHLQTRQDHERLDLARRAFYFKSGVRLSQQQDKGWKSPQLRTLCQQWGWDQGELLNLDSHNTWKLSRVMAERNLLVAELSRSYRLLTAFSRRYPGVENVDARDLSLLGRKLQADMERRPGKIDSVNPGISKDLSEDQVWLRHNAAQDSWQLYERPPVDTTMPLKSTNSLVEMLAWLEINQVIDQHTRIDVPIGLHGAGRHEHLNLLKVLRHSIKSLSNCHQVEIQDYALTPKGCLSQAFINVLSDHAGEQDATQLIVSERADPLNFGASQQNLIQDIDHLYANTWGEIHVDHYLGSEGLLEMLCNHLELYRKSDATAALDAYCRTPVHATAISKRLISLTQHLVRHFRALGDNTRYMLRLQGDFYMIARQRKQFSFQPIGSHQDLLDLLGEPNDEFRPSVIDPLSLPDSPLPTLLQLNQADEIQVFYRVRQGGIVIFVLDELGSLYEQWMPGASEKHLLIQLQRFFTTIQTWRDLPGQELPVSFTRLTASNSKYHRQKIHVPPIVATDHLELLLSTGRRGPWRDGFNLISGNLEFNSLQLGEHLYSQVARYLMSKRKQQTPYPIYLTGVITADEPLSQPIPLIELLRFKGLIEKRLDQAVQALSPD